MGLAPYGKATYCDQICKIVGLEDPGFKLDLSYFMRWRAIRTFSSAVRFGNTAEIWNERTSPIRAIEAGREPVISRPLYRIWPRVGVRKWVSRLKHVVLPAPFGPISA